VKYKAYSEYKTTGIEWLGDIPVHWDCKRLGGFFSERREKVSDRYFKPLSVTKNGIVPQLESAAKTNDGDNRKKVLSGDFVINSRSDRKGSSGLSRLNGSVSLINTVLTPKKIYGPFVEFLLKSQLFQEEYYKYGKGIVADLWSTNYSEMKNIYLPIPPCNEQIKIYDFLKQEVSLIDELLVKQEQLVNLLREKQQAVISHAVTKGINPDVKFKNVSGQWNDAVPNAWRVMPLRYAISKIEQGSSPLSDNNIPESNDIGVIKISAVKKGSFNEMESKKLFADSDFDDRYIIKKGDLLVTRGNTPELVADACYVKEEPQRKIMLSDLVYRLSPNKKVKAQFVCFALLSDYMRHQIKLDARGSSMTMAKVSQEHIKSWVIAIPPINEQVEIIDFLSKQLTEFERLFDAAHKLIHHLKERRSALISAAVTGKIDVRNWQSDAKDAA